MHSPPSRYLDKIIVASCPRGESVPLCQGTRIQVRTPTLYGTLRSAVKINRPTIPVRFVVNIRRARLSKWEASVALRTLYGFCFGTTKQGRTDRNESGRICFGGRGSKFSMFAKSVSERAWTMTWTDMTGGSHLYVSIQNCQFSGVNERTRHAL